MASYQNNIFEEKKLLPEQRLWQAVLGQAMYDLFSEYNNNYVENGDIFLAECWASHKHKDFVDVCRFAGFEPDYIFNKIKNMLKLKKLKKLGIIWNYRRKEINSQNEWKDNLSKM